ncbi:type I DNA topoisomerase [Candidatus Liberibacter asiaticus]|uniref:DNA topoisomerase 1 n=2 Tax=Liberibacter asiaticus TaxID=34021 RepID=C6XHN6_LIBAP|nr:type I DNA topoisomerase [Candidatus Liberibacter asiaticus]ACT56779.1 DNA topoisomerase I [Candidatus Liberibacter asiaticus str. psy62]AGH16546.1 DNA topoisomerase I [Candidatus Liberibacter asiaticus str. gxpsy]ALK06943.1 type I DNA topoisomerase [Candidatus Liberibacter asiaticus]ASK52412.1 DNA topoisomerase I [Candidatus Liberibacter asiaticus]AWL13737.1 type I DNA topoisomerase [Candidatus Liberibacter asiaticus]
MNVIIVESPAKAKTISKYLGSNYKVLSSFGHIRDLPAKKGSVLPEKEFEMIWNIDPSSQKHLQNIIHAVKSSTILILATDPDREGEAISWHVLDVLRQKNLIEKTKIQRVSFNAITKQVVLNAMKSPRDINLDLVNAYLARRALDYLVGFNLSPILWQKLPGARSAGRVQSVALRLICNRENQIESFVSEEYWSLSVLLETPRNDKFTAHLTDFNGQRIEKKSISNKKEADDLISFVKKATYSVEKIENKPIKRNPWPAFTTSTLQQVASSRLGFSASHTMRIAQKLYEGIDVNGEIVGLITYMRTDGVHMSPDALEAVRRSITSHYGDHYLPEKPRIYSSKSKNAQEAHEAIRPNDFDFLPSKMKQFLDSDQFQLYNLIWKRSVASQMASAKFERTTVNIIATYNDQIGHLRTTGSLLCFDGFLKVWENQYDQEKNSEEDILLPYISANEQLIATETNASQHFTEPPPRYSESSLIKKMEEIGIGRPSTYATILETLYKRKYVIAEKRKILPQNTGRIVTAFLENFFSQYVEYDFTADLEEKLDEISTGKLNWKEVLHEFWEEFIEKIDSIKKLRISNVLDILNDTLSSVIFPPKENNEDSRTCPECHTHSLSLKLSSKYGAFVGCTNYPECKYTRQLTSNPQDIPEMKESVLLGNDLETKESVTLRSGRFGLYVQRGDGKDAKRCSLPKTWKSDSVDYDKAMSLLSLPREIGIHPETQKNIIAGTGKYGYYLNHDGAYTKLESIEQVLTIDLEQAISCITEKKKIEKSSRKNSKNQGHVIGTHPEGGSITVHNGRYGPYLHWKKINASLSKEESPDTVDLEKALKILNIKKQKKL